MTIVEFARLVAQMRDRQTRFFRTRSSTTLQEARDLERRVDRAAAAILADGGDATQMELFPRPGRLP